MPAVDAVGAVRSGMGAVLMAGAAGGLAVLSDVRTGRPGSADESGGGDGAVTLAFGDQGVLAEVVGGASATEEFTDRWRAPGESYSQVWEERFGEHAYVPLAEQAVTAAQKAAGVTLADVDHVIVTGLHTRAVKAAARAIGARPESLVDDLTDEVGNAGTAHWALLLADVLDRAEPGQTIASSCSLTGAPCGCCARPICSPPTAGGPRSRDRIAEPATSSRYRPLPHLARVPRARAAAPPEPDRPAAPPSARSEPLEVRLRRHARRQRRSSTSRRRGSA